MKREHRTFNEEMMNEWAELIGDIDCLGKFKHDLYGLKHQVQFASKQYFSTEQMAQVFEKAGFWLTEDRQYVRVQPGAFTKGIKEAFGV